jgi:hypothetical protein
VIDPPLPRRAMNIGLMPNGSRASAMRPVRVSSSAKANMPRSLLRQPAPHLRQASSSTSVSEVVRKLTPTARSSWASAL